MAGTSLLTLIDDIATLLDDVATMTKIATKKTAGVLGDDLALNAQQVTGVKPDRELPVVWAVFKGAMVNKAILVPVALLISAFVPIIVTPLLMLGGLFLCFEGTEKVIEKLFHKKGDGHGKGPPPTAAHAEAEAKAEAKPKVDPVDYEKKKIRGAVRTDFILSAEIIVIALGTLTEATLLERVLVLVAIALLVNVVVYGLVGGIVKLDDAGIHLSNTEGDDGGAQFKRRFGRGIIVAAPYLMKTLGIVGTVAMFLVGGGIIVHGVGPIHHWLEHLVHELEHHGGAQAVAAWLLPIGVNLGVGLACGLVLVGIWTLINKIRGVEAHH